MIVRSHTQQGSEMGLVSMSTIHTLYEHYISCYNARCGYWLLRDGYLLPGTIYRGENLYTQAQVLTVYSSAREITYQSADLSS